jgi:hypothetical protein
VVESGVSCTDCYSIPLVLIEIPAVPVGTKISRWRPPNNLFGGINKRLVDASMDGKGLSPRYLPCHEGRPLNLCKVEKNLIYYLTFGI